MTTRTKAQKTARALQELLDGWSYQSCLNLARRFPDKDATELERVARDHEAITSPRQKPGDDST